MHNRRQFMRGAAIALAAKCPLASRAIAADSAINGRQAAALLRAEFVDATGGLHRLSELTRPLLLVDLWAAWCPGCVEELPAIERLNTQLGPETIDVVLISHEMNWQDDMAFARKNRLLFRFWRLSPHSAALAEAAFRMESDRFGLPQSLVFAGKARTLVHSSLGSMDWSAPPQLRRARAWLAAAS